MMRLFIHFHLTGGRMLNVLYEHEHYEMTDAQHLTHYADITSSCDKQIQLAYWLSFGLKQINAFYVSKR